MSVVSFKCRYEPLVSGGPRGKFGSEIYPLRLDVYGTHELSVNGTRVIGFAAPKAKQEFEVSMFSIGNAPARPFASFGLYEKTKLLSRDVSASAAVNINAYATTFTKTGQECWTTVGTAVLTLQTLIDAQNDNAELEVPVWQNRDNSFPDKIVASATHSAKHSLLKGRLFVSAIKVVANLRDETEFDVSTSNENAASAARELCLAIDRSLEPFFGIDAILSRPSAPFLAPFHVPEFRTPRMPLPASVYCMQMPRGEIDVGYWDQLFTIALARSGMTETEAIACFRSKKSYERAAFASLCVRALCVQAVSYCYLDDFLNRNRPGQAYDEKLIEGDEDFKMARLCAADDCEGVALEIYMHIKELAAANSMQLTPLLRAAQTFLAPYVPTLLLGCVTNAKMTAAQLDQKCAMAHTFCALIPFSFYSAALDGKEVPGPRIPILFAEGTAPIDPAMRPVDSYYENGSNEEAVAREAVRARKELGDLIYSHLSRHGADYANLEVFSAPEQSGSGDYSNFYKWVVSGMTNDFARQGELDFAFVDRDQQTFGVRANLVLDGDDEAIKLLTTLTYTKREAQLCDSILLDQQPIPAHRLTSPPQLRAMSKIPTTGGTSLHRRRTYITLRTRDHDTALARAIQDIKASGMVKQVTEVVYDIGVLHDGSGKPNRVTDVYFDF